VISYQLYIDGAWTGSGGDSVLTVLNPATEEAIGTVPEGTVADIDRAVAAARRAKRGGLGDLVQQSALGDVDQLGEAAHRWGSRSAETSPYLSRSSPASHSE